MALTDGVPDYILVNFRQDRGLELSRSNMEFAMAQPRIVRLRQNDKQTYRLESRPSGLTLAMTLTLNFQGEIWNLLYLTQNGPFATRRKVKQMGWTQM